MWRQLTVDHRVGRDLLWPRIKSKPEGQKYDPTPYYVWGECLLLIQKRINQSERFQDVLCTGRVSWNRWGSNLIRVEYFPRIYNNADLTRNPERLETPQHWTRTVLWQGHLHVNVHDIVWTARNIEETCASNSERVQIERTEISARSLDIYLTWSRNEEYGAREHRPEGKWKFHSRKNGTELHGDQAPCLHKYQCLESCNSTYD